MMGVDSFLCGPLDKKEGGCDNRWPKTAGIRRHKEAIISNNKQ
jgi:hypothetical protein